MRPGLARLSATRVLLDGEERLAFAGCDYLGLAHDPRVIQAARSAIAEFGVGVGASRRTSGDLGLYHDLEHDLAAALGVESAALLPDGWLADLAAAQALATPDALTLIDEHAHPSVRWACPGAVAYRHLDASDAARLARGHAGPVHIMTDGFFPAEGVVAPVLELLGVAGPRGIVLIDDAHATGVLGARGGGTRAHLEIDDPRLVITGTLAKALGSGGGFVAGTAEIIRGVRERALAYAATTPIAPGLAAAASQSFAILAREPERSERLRRACARLGRIAARLGVPPGPILSPVAAMTRGPLERLAARALEAGLHVPLMRYPSADSPAQLRIAVSSEHTDTDLDRLDAALT